MTQVFDLNDAVYDYEGEDEEARLEDELGSEEVSDRSFHDAPELPDKKTVAKVLHTVNEDGSLRRIVRARRSDFVHNIIHLDGGKFSFAGRDYLRPIYDRDDKQILLKTARQVEKCCDINSLVVLEDGSEVKVSCIYPGVKIVGMNHEGIQNISTVLKSEHNGIRPCRRIKTRLGSECIVTLNHPFRKLLGWVETAYLKPGDKIASLRTQGFFGTINRPWAEIIRELGLDGKHAHQKCLPPEVFSWDKKSAVELLRGLWCTDGHCKNVTNSKVDLVYGTTSPMLARQIRLLLRKFGIITTQREYQPKGDNTQRHYLLRVITRESIRAFYNNLAPIPAKTFTIPEVESNSNLDTLPREIHEIITEARKRKGNFWKHDSSFTAGGMKMSRKYCPTFEKVSRFNAYLGDEAIQRILDSDIIWDEVLSIEDVDERETWALETTDQTFVSDFLVNHNTTFLANNLTVTSVVQPYNKSLYVSPSHTQTRQFSNEKLRPAIEKSPLIKRYFQDSSVSYQVFEKGFTNGSYIFLRSAFRSADRTRGISAKILTLDEIQDFVMSEIPVIRECTSHFPDARILMAGTPKSHDNPIEVYWGSTSQNEWMVKCKACGKWNFLDEQNIAPTEFYTEGRLPPGPVCKGCQKPIYPHLDGKWISFKHGQSIIGYRIPQLMVPWICGIYEQWLKLLWKRDNYPFGQFYNEVLGLSYDSASKPITREELIECCCDYNLWPTASLNAIQQEAKKYQLTAGVDWGEGNDGSERSPTGKIRVASYTVLTIGAYVNQKIWKTFLIKKYMGKETDPEFIVKDIVRICNALDVKLVGVDWGHGWGVNNQLIRYLGPKRVVQYQHLPKLKQKMKWDHIGFRYHLHRNFMMSELFFDIRNKFVQFPRWKEFEFFAKDILGIFAEYVEYKREIKFDHRPSDPDDFFHSLLYSKLTSDVYLGKSRRYTFDIPDGIGANGLTLG